MKYNKIKYSVPEIGGDLVVTFLKSGDLKIISVFKSKQDMIIYYLFSKRVNLASNFSIKDACVVTIASNSCNPATA